MKRYVLDIEEAQDLQIRCRKSRTFDLDVDTQSDLTGRTLKMQVRDDSGTLILTFQPSDETLTVVGTTVRLRQTDTAMNVPCGCFRYDLIARHTDGFTETLLEGDFLIKPSITNV